MNRFQLICDSPDHIAMAVDALEKASLIANDVETFPFKKTQKGAHPTKFALTIASYSCTGGDFAFPLLQTKHPASGAPYYIREIMFAIRHINALPIPQVGHNFAYDVQWYLRYGVPVLNWAFDTMVMFWAKWPELPKDLAFVSSILLDDHQYWKEGLKSQDYRGQLEYAMTDTHRTLRICEHMIPMLLEDEHMRRNFVHGMLRCWAATGMNAFGSYVDEAMIESTEKQLRAEAEAALEKLRFIIADPVFNPNSPKQKKILLYKILGSPMRNRKGRPVKYEKKASTGAVVLRIVKQEGVIPNRIVTAIEKVLDPTKQISNIIKMPMLPTRSGRRRFLTFFDGVGTITTRFASRTSTFGHGSNAQNMRKKYRRILRADPGHFTLEADFAGADAVYVAFESEEPAMIDVFVNNKDMHATTASNLFSQWSYEAVVAGKKADDPKVTHPITGIRQVSKKVGHGCNYLMAAYTLLMTSTIPTIIAAAKEDGYADSYLWPIKRLTEYCEVLESRYRNAYTRLKREGSDSWYRELGEQLKAGRPLESIYGFTFATLGDPADDANLRVAAAFYGQANTAGRCNAALSELVHGIRTQRFRDGPAPDSSSPTLRVSVREHGIRVVRQTHDSLTFQCDARHPGLGEGINRIFTVLRRPFVCKGREFALGIDVDVGINWAHDPVPVRGTTDVLKWIAENPQLFEVSPIGELRETADAYMLAE